MRLRREKEMDPVEELPAELFEHPSALRGVRFDRDHQGRRLEALSKRIKEFPPIDGFRMWNGEYEAVDAEVLWAICRELRPKRVIQLGTSEWSSMIVAAALKANDNGAEHHRHAGHPRELGEDPFRRLDERDVLFVDSSHEVALGGDVPLLVLELLPLLARGVVVHFHDVLLPWQDRRMGTEQYLLQAFLSGNRDWEVLLGIHDLTRTQADLVRRLVPSWRGDSRPTAFWLHRT